MSPNIYDKSIFLRDTDKEIINNLYQNIIEPSEGASLFYPAQPTRTTSSEIKPVPNNSSNVQSRIDSLSQEEKALFNKYAIKYLDDKDDIVNKMTRAVVNYYPRAFPDLYNIYSTLYTKQRPVSEQESPIHAPQAVANPDAVYSPRIGIPITKEDIKYVITELAIKPWGGDAIVPWNLDDISNTILEASNLYNVDPRLFLAQGIQEGHFGASPYAGRSRRTRNLYNIGNVDSGRDRQFPSYSDGIRGYAELMNREYNWGNEDSWVTPEMMIENDFYRSSGQGRYATAPNYTNVIQEIVKRVDNKLAERNQGRRYVFDNNNNTWRIE